MQHFKSEINPKNINEIIIQIKGFSKYYISENGNVYKKLSNGYFRKLKLKPDKKLGYIYIGLTSDINERKTFRLHRIVAEYFIENPNNLNIVGHKNNIKHDNRKENLYWTTISENTKKII